MKGERLRRREDKTRPMEMSKKPAISTYPTWSRREGVRKVRERLRGRSSEEEISSDPHYYHHSYWSLSFVAGWTQGRQHILTYSCMQYHSANQSYSLKLVIDIGIALTGLVNFAFTYHLIAFSLRRREWRNKHMDNHKTCQSHDFL